MANQGRPSRIKPDKNFVKKFCLDNLFDVEQQKKISDREFLETQSQHITIDGERIFTGIWTFLTKHPDIIRAEPMKGRRIDEQSVYDYHVSIGNIDPDELPYEVYRLADNRVKTVCIINNERILGEIEKIVLGETMPGDIFTNQERERTLMTILGDKDYYELKEQVILDLNKLKEVMRNGKDGQTNSNKSSNSNRVHKTKAVVGGTD
jgi:hypothetical protein